MEWWILNTRTLIAVCLVARWHVAPGQQIIHFPSHDRQAEIQADQYGSGTKALILAHGGRFAKESWRTQAEMFAQSGFLVLAVRFRGDTTHADGSPSAEGSSRENADDILAAVAYLHDSGVKNISAVGASLGGDAVGEADARSVAGTFNRVVFLGSSGGDAPAKLSGRKLFIFARDDRSSSGPRFPEISSHYASAPEPKKLVLLKGSAHAQYLFDTEQRTLLMDTILLFLKQP